MAVLIAGLIAAAVTSSGIYAVSHHQRWAEKYEVYLEAFAAGVLVATVFIHIIPESLAMAPAAPVYLLAGYLAIHLIDRLINLYTCGHAPCSKGGEGIAPALGIGFHSLIDGIIYAVTYNVSIFTGTLAAIGMVLHEFPEGIIAYLLIEQSEIRRRRARLYAIGLAALTTPLGALIAYPLIDRFGDASLGALLALAGGVLTYVGATHLLPSVKEKGTGYTLLTLAAGVLVAVAAGFFGD